MEKINSSEQFETEVLRSDGVVLVDFYAEWCGPCKAMAGLLEELDRAADAYRIVKVDIDEQQELAAQYRITSVPTFLVFKSGEKVARSVGMKSRRELEQLLLEN